MTASAKVIAHSVSPNGHEVMTMELRYWRAIHSEFMTHRVFSRNASSSRAIPVKKVLAQVWSDPAGPIHWGANQAGMQANAELQGWRLAAAKKLWKYAGRVACLFAWSAMKLGLHKQVANRLLEPWQYITVIMTATEWENFFKLRCHPDAQPEIQELANKMHEVYRASKPERLSWGEWHLPYVSQEERRTLVKEITWKLCTARCARVSYLTHDGRRPDMEEDMALHDRLIKNDPPHASPSEHACQPCAQDKFFYNLFGWSSYRHFKGI